MNKFLAILGPAVIPLLSPLVGKAQSVSALHRLPFKIDELSTRQDTTHTWGYGEITNNAKKERPLNVVGCLALLKCAPLN